MLVDIDKANADWIKRSPDTLEFLEEESDPKDPDIERRNNEDVVSSDITKTKVGKSETAFRKARFIRRLGGSLD